MENLEINITPKLNMKDAERQLSDLLKKGNQVFGNMSFKVNLGNNKALTDLLSGKQTNINIGINPNQIQNQLKNTKFILNCEFDKKSLQDQLDRLKLNVNFSNGNNHGPLFPAMDQKFLSARFREFKSTMYGKTKDVDKEEAMSEMRLLLRAMEANNSSVNSKVKQFRAEFKNLDDATVALARTTKFTNYADKIPFHFSRFGNSLSGSAGTFTSSRILNNYIKNSEEFKSALANNKDLTVKEFSTNKKYTKDYATALKSITDDPSKINNITKLSAEFGTMAGLAGSTVTVLGRLGSTIVELGKNAVLAFEDIQSIKTQLGVVYSSQSQADNTFNQIEKYAKKSPFGVEVMAQQAILLKQSGVAAFELMDVMSRIGDISSGNAEKMKSISDVYARIISSTTMTARDMRQLSTAGVPSYDALSHVKSEKTGEYFKKNEIRSMLQAGKVTSRDFENLVKYLTDEGGQFYGAVNVGSKTFKARKQNLDDAKQMALAYWGEALATMNFGSVLDMLGSNPVFGSGNINSLYSKNTETSAYQDMINLLEKTYQRLEDWAQHGVMVKEYQKAVDQKDYLIKTFTKDTSDYNDLQKFGIENLRSSLGENAISNAIMEEESKILNIAKKSEALLTKDINIIGFEREYKDELEARDALKWMNIGGVLIGSGATLTTGGTIAGTSIAPAHPLLGGAIVGGSKFLGDGAMLAGSYIAGRNTATYFNKHNKDLDIYSNEELEKINDNIEDILLDIPKELKKKLTNTVLNSYLNLEKFQSAVLTTTESLSKLTEEISSGINIMSREKKLYDSSIIGSFENKVKEYNEHMNQVMSVVDMANKIRATDSGYRDFNISGVSEDYNKNKRNEIAEIQQRYNDFISKNGKITKEYLDYRANNTNKSNSLYEINKKISNLEYAWKNKPLTSPKGINFEGTEINFGTDYTKVMDGLLSAKKDIEARNANESTLYKEQYSIQQSLVKELQTANGELVNFTKSVSDLYNVNSIQDGIDWSKVTLDDYSSVVKLLSISHSPLSNLRNVENLKEGQTTSDLRLTKTAIEEGKVLLSNLEKVYAMWQSAFIDDKYLNSLTQAIRLLQGTLNGNAGSGNGMKSVILQLSNLNKDLKSDDLGKAAFVLEDAMTSRQYDMSPQIKQKTPYKWQYAQANLTNLNPALVALSSTSDIMGYYKNKTIQRQTMANLSKAMLSNNQINYLKIGEIISSNAGKYNGRQMYETDFRDIAKSLEEIAKNGDKTARDAYVQSKQSQIDKLDELFINGMTSIDEAEEIRKLADANGMSFSYKVTKDELGRSMASFSELTLETARTLRDQLTNEKIQQSIINSFKDVADSIKENFSSLSLQSAIAHDNIIITQTEQERKQVLKYMNDAMKGAQSAFDKTNNKLALLTDTTSIKLTTRKSLPVSNFQNLVLNNEDSTSELNIFPSKLKMNSHAKKAALEQLEKYATAQGANTWLDLNPKQIEGLGDTLKYVATKGISAYKTLTLQDKVSFKVGDKARKFNEQGIYNTALSTLGLKNIYDNYINAVGNNSSSEMEKANNEFNKKLKEIKEDLINKSKAEQDAYELLVELTIGASDEMKNIKDIAEATVKSTKEKQSEIEMYALRDRNISLALTGNEQIKEEFNDISGFAPSFQRDIMKELGVDEYTTWESYNKKFNDSLPEKYLDWFSNDIIQFRDKVDSYHETFEDNFALGRKSKAKGAFYEDLKSLAKGGDNEALGDLIIEQLKNSNISFKGDDEKSKRAQLSLDVLKQNGFIHELFLGDLFNVLNALSDTQLELFSPEQLEALGIARAGLKSLSKDMEEFKKNLTKSFEGGALNAINASFTAIGEHLGDIIYNQNKNISLSEKWAKSMKGAVGSIMSQIGPMMTLAGLNMIAKGDKSDWAKGIALAAAGGAVSIFGSLLNSNKDKNKDSDEAERLEKLRDNLKELLEQARDDAAYYEAEMLNKKAIATNNAISETKVNDMILTPQGNFSTHPDDYIIATKTPQLLNGGGARGGSVINSYVYNSASDKVAASTEVNQNEDGSFDLITTINAVVNKAMAEGEFNDSMAIAQQNQSGRQVFA